MRFGGVITFLSCCLLTFSLSQAQDTNQTTNLRSRTAMVAQAVRSTDHGLSMPPTPVGSIPAEQPARVKEYSWIYIDTPEPRQIKLNDIVTIIIDEKSEVTLNSRFNRQRTESFIAELKEFVRLESLRLGNVASTEPSIDTTLQERLQTTGQLTDKEGLQTRIAASVVDVLPNGNIVVEARKMIQSNQELWEYTLTGTMRSIDISQNNTVLSEHIANLNIKKTQKGKVYDSTKRRWGTYLIDLFWPF